MSDHMPPRLGRVDVDARIPLQRWGAAVRTAREDLRVSQEALGDRAGVTQQTISKVERGTVCPTDRVKVTIAHALGADVGVLFGWPPMDCESSPSGGSEPNPT